MIEFRGYITGDALKFYRKNTSMRGLTCFSGALALLSPWPLIIFIQTGYWKLLVAYGSLLLIVALLPFLPKGKKWHLDFTPKRIYTEEGYIISEGRKFEDAHSIESASRVIDYGNFYYIKFPFGQMSDYFVCQKSLLAQGTLEEFEALFEGKIERRVK